ncbi:MAG: S49 family peptidase, partial [Deltaproteobacteria bacterium]|nr:S49 family peptidase [Deltaproteobacteria bacterium]
ALEDQAVKAILLDIDSPGGQVNGVADFASQVYEARKVKPVVAYISGSGASGAYWIGSAAWKVAASPTAIIGSIGIVATRPGVKPADDVDFISSVSPKKRPSLKTASGLAQIQAEIDALGEVFVQTVAKYRGTKVKTVLENFGQGGFYIGAQAAKAGMVDYLTTFEKVLSWMVKRSKEAPVKEKPAQKAQTKKPEYIGPTDPFSVAVELHQLRHGSTKAEALEAVLKERGHTAQEGQGPKPKPRPTPEPDFMAEADRLAAKAKISRGEAIKRLARERPELHKAFLEKQAQKPVGVARLFHERRTM